MTQLLNGLRTTAEFAALLRQSPATIRKNLCEQGHHLGAKPIKLANRRLMWRAEDAVRIMAGSSNLAKDPTNASWNYRIFSTGGGLTFREVYYDSNGTPEKYSANDSTIFSDTPQGLANCLELMLNALDKPILSEDDFASKSKL